MDSSTSELFISSVNELNQQLENATLHIGGSVQDDQLHCTAFCAVLLTAICRLFKQGDLLNEGAEEEEELSILTLRSLVERLRNEWGFHKTFLKWTNQCKDADEIVQNMESLVFHMRAVNYKIEGDLITACRKQFVTKKPLKLSHLLRESQKKFEHFHPEIVDALDHLLGVSRSINLKYPFQNYFSYISLIVPVERNLEVISGKFNHCHDIAEEIDAFRNKLARLRSFFDRLSRLLFFNCYYPENWYIANFFTHVASVATRAAKQSCVYWFKEMDVDIATNVVRGLLDLQEEIDPIALQFLQLSVRFLSIVARHHSKFLYHVDIANVFLDYVLGVQRENHHWLLYSLVNWAIDEIPREKYREDFLADLSIVLREALPLRDVLFRRKFISPSLYEVHKTKLWFLEQKIQLLRIEIFFQCQVESKPTFLQSTDENIESFRTSLEELRNYSEDISDMDFKNETVILNPLDEVMMELGSLYQSFKLDKITEDNARDSLSMMLLQVNLLKAGLYLMELVTVNAGEMAFWKDQVIKLHEGIKFLALFVALHPQEDKDNVKLISTDIDMVAKGILSQYYKVVGNRMTKTDIEKMFVTFSELLDKVNFIKRKLREMCYQLPISDFPKTDGLGFITFLLGNIEELMNCKPDSVAPIKHYLNQILLELRSLRSLLVKLPEHPKSKYVGEAIVDIAYKVEYAVDSIEVGTGDNWKYSLCLYYLFEEDIRTIKIQATEICEEKTSNCATFHNAADTSSRNMPKESRIQADRGLVPLSDEEELIITRLTRGSSRLDIVPIVGMPGIGKSMLAKRLYNHPKVTSHFHARAWCSVSQEYQKKELLLEILSNIRVLTDRIHQMDDEDLALELYQQLKRNAYLIVMDDVWNIAALTDLEGSLPDDRNGSRILITSRLHDVATKSKFDAVPHSIRLLSHEESWELLQMKTFPESSFPDELLGVGEKIAENCKGLPLAIIAVAGIMRRTENQQDKWKEVAENLSSLVVENPETRCKEILQLSYHHLPPHLRTCFLYLGTFREDRDILIRKLKWLWVAEGFVQVADHLKCSEDAAEECLRDLVDCSLVMISKRRSDGRGKTCRVHDMLRDLSLSKAREENFFQLITRHDEPYASFGDSDYGADFDDHFPFKNVRWEAHRLCIYLKRKHFALSRPCGPFTRSVMFFSISDTNPRRPYDVTFIAYQFKLLRTLDLECINLGTSFPTGIELLVQLRYLAVSGDIDAVPPSIANLWKLETFVVKGLKDKILLPDTIWCMEKLRNLHVNNICVFSLEDDTVGPALQLEKLITLSSPSFSHTDLTEKIIARLPHLRKLKCMFSGSRDTSSNYSLFTALSFLHQLESLNIFYSRRILNPGEVKFPASLKKLTLSHCHLPWSLSSAIGRLENLEVLKLLSGAFEGPTWDMTVGEFLKLRYLKLGGLTLVQWNASDDHLPSLNHLVLQNCKDLEEVPLSFADIHSLEMIEVQWCGKSTEESVRNIADEGIEGLKILINHLDQYI